jgi:hypothetical protein
MDRQANDTVTRAEAGDGADPTARRYGVYYPTHHVVAVLRDEPAALAAVDALRRAGWAEPDVHHYSAEQVLEARRQYLEHRSLSQRLGVLVSSVVADEREARDEYLEAAARGAHFLVVYAPSAEGVHTAHLVLAGHGAWAMRHYGPSVMTDLPDARRLADADPVSRSRGELKDSSS